MTVLRRGTFRTAGRGTRESENALATAGESHALRRQGNRIVHVTRLVPTSRPDGNELETLSGRLTELELRLEERVTELRQTKSDLAAFRIRYRADVGLLHEELDELERAIAAAELGQLSQLIEDAHDDMGPSSAGAKAEPLPRFTSDAIRKLFRDVAKTIHPDLSSDQSARDRRHALMVEANRAYAIGDEERLRSILESWEKSPEAVQGSDAEATRQRLIRRIGQVEEEIARLEGELKEIHGSPLWKLKQMVDEAAESGKDLIEDMVRRLKRDITAARNRLDAMLWNP